MDEDFFQAGIEPAPFIRWDAKGPEICLKRLRIIAADVQSVADLDRLPHARLRS